MTSFTDSAIYQRLRATPCDLLHHKLVGKEVNHLLDFACSEVAWLLYKVVQKQSRWIAFL